MVSQVYTGSNTGNDILEYDQVREEQLNEEAAQTLSFSFDWANDGADAYPMNIGLVITAGKWVIMKSLPCLGTKKRKEMT